MTAAISKKQRAKPRGRPFKKGESGNPSGRPAVAKEVRELIRMHSTDAVECIVKLMVKSKSEWVRLEAAKELLAQGIGKAPQGINFTDPEGSALMLLDVVRRAVSGAD